MSPPRIVVVGDVMVDVVAVTSGPLAVGSDTPARVSYRGGGSAANVAAWLGFLDVPTAYVGRVGDDPPGLAAVEELRRLGVEVRARVDAERPTGTCVVLVAPDGERTMLPTRGPTPASPPPTCRPTCSPARRTCTCRGTCSCARPRGRRAARCCGRRPSAG